MKYGGPWISQRGRDGLVTSEDHFVGAEPAGLKATIALGTTSTFCRVCIGSHVGDVYFSTRIMADSKGIASACWSPVFPQLAVPAQRNTLWGQEGKARGSCPSSAITSSRGVELVATPFGHSAPLSEI